MTKEEALRISNLPEAEKEAEIVRLTKERFRHRSEHLPPPNDTIMSIAREPSSTRSQRISTSPGLRRVKGRRPR